MVVRQPHLSPQRNYKTATKKKFCRTLAIHTTKNVFFFAQLGTHLRSPEEIQSSKMTMLLQMKSMSNRLS